MARHMLCFDFHIFRVSFPRQKIDAQQHPQSGMKIDKTSDCDWQQPCLYQFIVKTCAEAMQISDSNQQKNTSRAFLSTSSKIQHK